MWRLFTLAVVALALFAAPLPDPVNPDPTTPRPIEAVDSVFIEDLSKKIIDFRAVHTVTAIRTAMSQEPK